MNSIYGGSLFSAVDPIPMIQLVNLIGDDYIIWDKSAEISFKRPAKEDLFAEFDYSDDELKEIVARVKTEDEIDIIKTTKLKNQAGDVFCEVKKVIYVADKKYFKAKKKSKP